jgi:peptide/nickel transport system permease protein
MFFLTVWLGATLIFFIPRFAPGDPIASMVSRMSQQGGRIENAAQIIEAWRARFGLDAPLHIQYLRFLGNILRLDFGYSLAAFPATVTELIASSLPWTIALLSIAIAISFIVGNTIGAVIAWRRTPNWVKQLLPITTTFTSVPYFMLGILFMYVFAFWLDWFPFTGGYDTTYTPGFNWDFIKSALYYGTLPALSLVLSSMGFWSLGMRGMMITTDGEDYMILAEAKGLRPRRVFWLYGVRNSILPQITALALSIGGIAGGALLVEQIFAYPGLGYRLYWAIINTDYAMMQGIVMMLIIGTAAAVLVLDLLYPLIDPRITFEKN